MASKFWEASSSEDEDEDATDSEASSGSDSDSDSDASSSSSDSDEGKPAAGASRFLKGGSDSDDSDDDERRVIKSAKDKRYEELRATTEEIRNKMKINDFLTLLTLFEKLNKQLDRAVKLSVGGTAATPRMYVRILVQLEDHVEEAFSDKDLRK